MSHLKARIAQGEVELRAIIATALLATCLCTGMRAAHSGEAQIPRPDAAGAPALQIDFDHGLLSLAAHRAPWKRVLDRITEKTGIRFRSAAPLAGSVSLSIEPLPVRQALERLLGPGADFICRYGPAIDSRGSQALPQEVWILGGERFAGSEALANQGGRNVEEPGSPTVDSAFEVGRAVDETGADSAAEQREIDTLVELAEGDDPALRMQALSALGDRGAVDDGTVRSTLEAALADRDAGVRGQALQALAVRGGGEAVEHLRQALRDADASVRIVAVERVEPKDEGIALLQEALADADETVRSLATSRLREAGKQGGTE
ncbi:MAG: HEAT repeat domain-containing protein [Gammaproteobacteria bacterium]